MKVSDVRVDVDKNRRKARKLTRHRTVAFYLFILPWIIGFLAFTLGPFILSATYSFSSWDLLSPPRGIGFDNYVTMTKDPLFWQSLKVTLTFTAVSVPLSIAFALLLAISLNQKIHGVGVLRTIFYLPAVLILGVPVSLLWAWMYHPSCGLINYYLSLVGIKGVPWLVSETWALPAIIIMTLWGCGNAMIILLAGLQGIPIQFYEAAEIDGANWWDKFRSVTIPMLSPAIFFNLIMGIISSFQIFTQAFIMTKGGPNNATLFYLYFVYQNAFQWFKMGYASTLAWVMLLMVLVLTLLVFKLSSKWVYYEAKRR